MGSSLLAVGLYTAAFEAVVRIFRVGVAEHIELKDADREGQQVRLHEAKRAVDAIRFCGQYLVQRSVATEDDIWFLQKARVQRNRLVHAAIDSAFVAPKIADVSQDISRMISIAGSVERWQRSFWLPPPDGVVRAAVMFSGLLQSCLWVATELANDHLLLKDE